MKVCHYTTMHDPFELRIFHKMACSTAKLGYEVIVVAPHDKEETRNGVKIIPIKKYKSRIKRFLNTPKLKNILLMIDADIYHFHDPELLMTGKPLLKRGKKVIYDSHEDVPRQILAKEWIPLFLRKPISIFFEMYENRVAKKISAIIAPTPFIEDRFRKINKNVSQICNFPLLSEFAEYCENHTKTNSGCYVGDLSFTRGIRQIAKASEISNIELILCGKFHSQGLENEILTSYKHVRYLGFLDRAEVSEVLYKSKVGFVTLLNSPNDANSYPIKMFEYMAAGIPVISSNFEVYREIVEKNKCGICVNPYDTDEISHAIDYIIQNPEKAKIMGDNGRRAILEKYNWLTQEKKLIAIYEDLLGEKH